MRSKSFINSALLLGVSAWLLPQVGDAATGKAWTWDKQKEDAFIKQMSSIRSKGIITFSLNSRNKDPYVRLDSANVDASTFSKVRMRVRNNTNKTNWRIYFDRGSGYAGNSVNFSVPNNNTWRTITVDMASAKRWQGTIHSIRIDMTPFSSGRVGLDKVELLSDRRLPNIIFYMADDLGRSDLGAYGQDTLPTPNLDQFADEGMRFTEHYSGSGVCSPSRATLMTGLHTGHSPVRNNHHFFDPNKYTTVADILKEAGYTTGIVGKWGVGKNAKLSDPNKSGFDYFYGYADMNHAHNFYPEFIVENGKKITWPNKCGSVCKKNGVGFSSVRKRYAPDELYSKGLKFIRDNTKNDKPFFLYYSTILPHENSDAPKELSYEVPDFGPFKNESWPDIEKGYARMVNIIDDEVGGIMRTLENLGISENTLFFFTSDNGGGGKHNNRFFNSNGIYRQKKRWLYEGGIRVPLMARWTGTIKPGSVRNHVSYFPDFIATVADLVGRKTPSNIDGISYLSTLLGQSGQAKHDYLYWEYDDSFRPLYDGQRAIRKGKYKLYVGKEANTLDRIEELYNLETNPEEDPNRQSRNIAKKKELRNLLKKASSANVVPKW